MGMSEYPIAKYSLFPISRFFFYSKGFAAKTKVDQSLVDEFLTMFTVKTQKSIKPPLWNNSGTHFTSKILMPGRVTDDIDGNRIGEIGRNDGVTQAEFNFYNMLKGNIDEKTVSPVFQGESPQGQQTATEIL